MEIIHRHLPSSLPPALLQLRVFILIFWMIELSAENLGFVFHQGLSGAQGPQGMDVNFTNDYICYVVTV